MVSRKLYKILTKGGGFSIKTISTEELEPELIVFDLLAKNENFDLDVLEGLGEFIADNGVKNGHKDC